MAAKIKNAILIFCSLMFLGLLFIPATSMAQSAPCGDNCSTNGGPSGNPGPTGGSDTCNNTENSNGTIDNSKVNECVTANPIVADIQTIVDFLSAGVGIIVAAVIIIGGIQYSMAGDNPQAVTAAKKRITDGLIALIAFLFIFAFVQWLIPGGVFK